MGLGMLGTGAGSLDLPHTHTHTHTQTHKHTHKITQTHTHTLGNKSAVAFLEMSIAVKDDKSTIEIAPSN